MKSHLTGVTATSFRLGLTGPTIYAGANLAEVGVNGDVFFRTGSQSNWYTRANGAWEPLIVPSIVAAQIQTVMRGIPATINAGVTYVGISADTATVDSDLIRTDSTSYTADLEPQAVTTITLPNGVEGVTIIVKDEQTTYPFALASNQQVDGQPSQETPEGALEVIFSGGAWRLVGR